MLIDKYIENALYLYQCVIVPGFGGFITLDEPEGEKENDGKYRPAGKAFIFNPALKVNDGVLAMYISNMRDISYADAMAEITHAVDFYLSTLEKGDPVDIAGVGVIRVDGKGGLSFSQSGVKNFSRGHYGLTSAVVPTEEKVEKTTVTYEHESLQITPAGEEPEEDKPAESAPKESLPVDTGGKEEGVKVVKKAFQMVVNAATYAGIKDNTVENKAIGDMINAVLMEAVEKATIEKYQVCDQDGLRSLISSAAERAKKEDDAEGNQAIDSIVSALMAYKEKKEAPEDGSQPYEMETFSAEGLIEEEKDASPDEEPSETVENIPVTDGGGNGGDGTDNDDEEEEDDDSRPSPFHSKPVRAVIGAVVVVAVLVGLFFFVYRGGANLYFWKDEPNNNMAAVTAKDTLKSDTLTKDTLRKDTAIVTAVPTPAKPVNPDALDTAYVPDKPFYVIAASVEFRQNAERALKELRAQGYPAEYAGYQNGLYMIAYQGFYSRTEAQKMYGEILDKTDNLGVWIKVYNRNADKKTD